MPATTAAGTASAGQPHWNCFLRTFRMCTRMQCQHAGQNCAAACQPWFQLSNGEQVGQMHKCSGMLHQIATSPRPR
eukprot:359018-Chlamydomonas_euryale.AAC.3